MSTSNINQLFLRGAKAFLLDMDGTFFLGDHLLPGALDLLELLNHRGLPFCFLTNNTSRSKLDYIRKLSGLGIREKDARVYTAGDATIAYLKKHHPDKRVFLLGTPSLAESFSAAGVELSDSDPEVVVIGFDTSLTYTRLSAFCRFVRQGLPYIATHPDVNCPTPEGPAPDIGAMMSLVEASTGRSADVVIGKPNPGIVSALAEGWGLETKDLVMVGDRLYTDIALGKTSGVKTVLVLTGETKREDLANALFQPDLVCEDLGKIVVKLKEQL
jgi:HAD superfamily hydrolase (TIGR01457 family)